MSPVSVSEIDAATGPHPTPSTHLVYRIGSGQLHRTVALLAVISLFIGTVTSFDTLIWTNRLAGISIMIGYALAIVLAAAAFVARGSRALLTLDIGILICTLLVRMPEFLISLGQSQGRPNAPYATDEGALVDTAGRALADGHNPYTVVWTGAHVLTHSGITPTMSGGVIDRFDYPAMSALMAAATHWLLPSQPSAALVGLVGLLGATLLMFVLLPAPWRSAATMVCLGLGLYLLPFARQGYPSVLLLPFLVMAVYKWTRVGRNGRLGGLGVVSALGLGLACATQQIAWFLAPFLLSGLVLLWAGNHGWRRACRLFLQYAGVAVVAFAVVNAPFAVWNFDTWRTAMTTPLVARTAPHGQGLIGLTYDIINGSGALHAFSYAAAALALGLFASYVIFIRKLGPAMAVLPWLIFYLSIRASDRYF